MVQGIIVDSNNKEIIELSLPVNPAYVSSARLTASSIANRMGFDIECTEDIKSAVSEACAYLIHRKSQSGVKSFKIKFCISPKNIEVTIDCESGSESTPDDNDLGIKMIKALMDSAELTENDKGLVITMTKVI